MVQVQEHWLKDSSGQKKEGGKKYRNIDKEGEIERKKIVESLPISDFR